MPGYANALARYFSSLFGGGGGGQGAPKLQGQKNGETNGSNISVRKRSSANNRSGSSFATASQGDAAYYGEDGSTPVGNHSKPQKKKQLLSRSQSQSDKGSTTPSNKSNQQMQPQQQFQHQSVLTIPPIPGELYVDLGIFYICAPPPASGCILFAPHRRTCHIFT